MFLGLLIFKNGLGPAEIGSDEMDPSIFFFLMGMNRRKPREQGIFIFLRQLGFTGSELRRRNVFLQLGPPAHSNILRPTACSGGVIKLLLWL